MPVVLDASVAVSWGFADEDFPVAHAASALVERYGAVVPVWWFETRNVLLMGERRGRITAPKISTFLAKMFDLDIEVDHQPQESRIFRLARSHRLTFYDAAYLEVAERRHLALATLDKQLIAAALLESVGIVGAA